MDDKNESFYRVDNDEIEKSSEGLNGRFLGFLDTNELDKEAVIINKNSLVEVAIRVDKRKHYYHVFHGIEHISEFKEIALYVFWILKLKPFGMKDENHKIASSINEHFAVHLILLTMKSCCSKKKRAYIHPCREFIDDIIYSLRFQDISKEALMLFIDTLAFSYGIYQSDHHI